MASMVAGYSSVLPVRIAGTTLAEPARGRAELRQLPVVGRV